MGIKLGDLVSFDIMGILIKTKVVNLRRVKWTSFLPNFFILFAPGALEDAPKTYLATVENRTLDDLADIQEQVVDKLPNVSVINVVELVGKIMGLFATLGLTLKFMAYLSLLMGSLVILSIALFERRNQIKAMLILETLGMSRAKTSLIVIGQFALIYFMASLLAYLFSIVMSYNLAQFYFDGTWKLFWEKEMLVVVIGFLAIVSFFIPLQKSQEQVRASSLLQSE
jgi:putative ABC transport system permease protein